MASIALLEEPFAVVSALSSDEGSTFFIDSCGAQPISVMPSTLVLENNEPLCVAFGSSYNEYEEFERRSDSLTSAATKCTYLSKQGTVCDLKCNSPASPVAVCPTVTKLGDPLCRCDVSLDSTCPAAASWLNAKSESLGFTPAFVSTEEVVSCTATPSSGIKRGRKKKGFYEYSVVRRSARLGRSSERTVFTSGGLPESSVVDTSVSGAGMVPLLGSTYIPCALNSLSNSDMLALARNSGFTFDDIQLDTDHIRARELERVNSLSS